MRKYRKQGTDDPLVQIMIARAELGFGASLVEISQQYTYEAAAAIMLTAAGNVLGELQARFNQHAEECEDCAKHVPDFYELAVKNFGAGFCMGKSDMEKQHAEGAAEADDHLARILKEHKP